MRKQLKILKSSEIVCTDWYCSVWTAVCAKYVAVSNENLNNVNHTIVENWLPSLSTARNMNTTMSNIRLNETVISTAEINEDISANIGYLEKEMDTMEELLKSYQKYIT